MLRECDRACRCGGVREGGNVGMNQQHGVGVSPAKAIAKAQAAARRESLELAMLQQLRALKLDAGMVREFKFAAPDRQWRADFAWPAHARPLLLEVDGAVHTGGRHTRGDGFTEDCVKLNEAQLRGWRVLRVTGEQVKSGAAAAWVERMLNNGGGL